MNLNQKIILFISSLFLLIGTVTFLLFPLFISSVIFIIFFVLIMLLTIIILYFNTTVKKPKEKPNIFPETNQILFSARSVFPFQLFPDKYFVQEKTITIVRKKFFSQGWVETIAIKDIGGLRVYTGPLFSNIMIIRKILPQTTVELRNLWKKDAFKIKELLDGLIITQNNLIEMPKNIPLKVEKKILSEIGREKEIEKEI